MVLKTVINLDIADILHRHRHSPTTFSELVSSLPKPCTNHQILRRLLRYMAHMQLLTIVPPSSDKEGEESYELTTAAKYIVKGHEKSLAPYAIYRLGEHHLPTMHALDLSLSGDPETSTLAMDIIMMAYTGGKERNEKEWKELLMAAGFTKFKITPIMALQHVIEATV
ncbi:hypothetical protein J5N97_023064 [Dioscorea zingiberensis]|uniref:Uncharacterized protein n=1 Tax=Dioscorea zingiberensis TaxID=325984 RepID=A0A9D5HBF3_9LILI|nr:hypothetical protein J5N97_023064 [Dioscorea zingiberensis]